MGLTSHTGDSFATQTSARVGGALLCRSCLTCGVEALVAGDAGMGIMTEAIGTCGRGAVATGTDVLYTGLAIWADMKAFITDFTLLYPHFLTPRGRRCRAICTLADLVRVSHASVTCAAVGRITRLAGGTLDTIM